MKVIYPAIFHSEDNSYWVEFPDLEGCQTFGDTVEETFYNSKQALSSYCVTLLEQGKKLPKPTPIENLTVEKICFTSLIEANLTTKQKAVKKTLTIPSWLNDRALEKNINFSQVLQESLIEKLDI